MRIGIYVLPNLPWAELEERWRTVDALEFDGLWSCDDLYWPDAPRGPWFDGLVVLAGMAARTSAVRVGTLVLSLPLHHPAVLAKRAVALDHLSGGRLELGFGAGLLESDHLAGGQIFWGRDERLERFREAVELLDSALRQEVTTYEGRYYRTEDLWMTPAPLQRPRPPLILAAHSASMLRIVAERADVWSSWGGFVDSEEEAFRRTRDRAGRLDDLCRELGRDPSSLGRNLLVFQSSAHAKTRARLRPWVSVGAFEELVGRYGEIGMTELVFYYPEKRGDLQVMEQVAAEVLPRLRAGVSGDP